MSLEENLNDLLDTLQNTSNKKKEEQYFILQQLLEKEHISDSHIKRILYLTLNDVSENNVKCDHYILQIWLNIIKVIKVRLLCSLGFICQD